MDRGTELLRNARHAVAATDFALERVQKVKGKASGLLRLSCQTGFARLQVVPRLAEILRTFPDLDVELTLQDSWPNLVERGIDLRIHIGEIEDETVIAQLIGHSVGYTLGDGTTGTGIASSVSYSGAVPTVKVGDLSVPLDSITGLTAPATS